MEIEVKGIGHGTNRGVEIIPNTFAQCKTLCFCCVPRSREMSTVSENHFKKQNLSKSVRRDDLGI